MNRLFFSPRTVKLKFLLYMGTVVTIFVAAVFYWMFQQSKSGVLAQIDRQAVTLLQQVIIMRSWVADHGGLYVERRTDVEENPFLPGTNITDSKGKVYVFRPPAIVTRELSEYADVAGLYRFRLTSLKLRNPANAPLPFEKKALLQFENKDYDDIKEGIASEATEEGTRFYRRIVPLRTEEACLECHADQGYKVGDIRGGLSVIIPMTAAMETIERNRISLMLTWFGIICLISGVIYFLLKRMVLKPVDHLQNVAHRLINGEYAVKARLSTGDEFEELADAFNKMTDRLKKGYEGTIRSLVAATEARDPYIQGHTERVSTYAVGIAKEIGLTSDEINDVTLGATLHDIGKIGVADAILGKSTSLTEKERHEMETHVQKGTDIIHEADFLLHALPAIQYHHERPDGRGYPGGVKMKDLPLIARIIAVADSYDAMTTDRPYRKGMADEEAMKELEKRSGTQFDADVVKAFRSLHDKKYS
ncbi:MAG: HD domain-containing phosphohydrolase [Thermodesulfovibrionales bacterium]